MLAGAGAGLAAASLAEAVAEQRQRLARRTGIGAQPLAMEPVQRESCVVVPQSPWPWVLLLQPLHSPQLLARVSSRRGRCHRRRSIMGRRRESGGASAAAPTGGAWSGDSTCQGDAWNAPWKKSAASLLLNRLRREYPLAGALCCSATLHAATGSDRARRDGHSSRRLTSRRRRGHRCERLK